MADKLTNQPVTPSKEMLELLKDWVAPDVSEVKKATVVGKTNFMGMSIEDMYKKKVQVEQTEEEEVQPLTAEEIEQIRQDAYNEGFSQGKEEGVAAGHAEGLEKGHAEGLEQGHQEGIEAGREEGREAINEAINRWQALAEQLVTPIERVDKAAEQQLLSLAVMLAESVLRTEIKSNKESILAALHESIAALPFNTEIAEIHLHPQDIELLKEEYDDDAIVEQKWILKPEPTFELGDVMVATPNSLIDRTVKTRIKQTIDDFIQNASLDKETNSGPGLKPAPMERNQPTKADEPIVTEHIDDPAHTTSTGENTEPTAENIDTNPPQESEEVPVTDDPAGSELEQSENAPTGEQNG